MQVSEWGALWGMDAHKDVIVLEPHPHYTLEFLAFFGERHTAETEEGIDNTHMYMWREV